MKFIFLLLLATQTDHGKGYPLLKKSAIDLLICKEWTLIAKGYDENNNGIIEDWEEMSTICEKDDTYVFNNNGKGYYYENTRSCGSGVNEYSFQWKFNKNFTALNMSYGTLQVLLLTDDQLILKDNTSKHSPLITVFHYQ